MSEEDVAMLGALAAAETGSEHPLGRAIAAYASKQLRDVGVAVPLVDEWASLDLDVSPRLEIDRIMRGRRRVELRRRAGAVRRRARAVVQSDPSNAAAAPTPFRIAHKFPPITAEEVIRVASGLHRSLDRFGDVTARLVAPDLVLFERR